MSAIHRPQSLRCDTSGKCPLTYYRYTKPRIQAEYTLFCTKVKLFCEPKLRPFSKKMGAFAVGGLLLRGGGGGGQALGVTVKVAPAEGRLGNYLKFYTN